MKRSLLLPLFFIFCLFQFGFAHSTIPSTEKKQKTTVAKLACIKKTVANIAPTITATGNQAYCPLSNISIVTNISITDPDDTSTEAIYIQISSGYNLGQDVLF
ncbi:MAG: lectin, partial [Flavobacterium sp.]